MLAGRHAELYSWEDVNLKKPHHWEKKHLHKRIIIGFQSLYLTNKSPNAAYCPVAQKARTRRPSLRSCASDSNQSVTDHGLRFSGQLPKKTQKETEPVKMTTRAR